MARDTIYALSTPGGRAAISIVRLSGPQAGVILKALAGPTPARMFHVTHLVDPQDGSIIDHAVVAWLPGPATYTGEDTAEFHLHGSLAIQRVMFDVLARFAEVRPAEPGEFTRRAVLNGKMDVVEAEGLADLLDAQTSSQRQQALSHLLGSASAVFELWRERLLLIRADIEAAVDFADEVGVAEEASARVDREVTSLLEDLEIEMARSRTGQIVRDGVRVVLCGPPNTGKSSLLNALVRREAAIVSAIPGTTRDVIEVHLDLEGLSVILTDTAGLRDDVSDIVEAEGVRRSRSRLGSADIVVWVASPDISGSYGYDRSISPDLIVSAKRDLGAPDSGLIRNESDSPPILSVSAATGEGIPELLAALANAASLKAGGRSALIVSARQKQAVLDAVAALKSCLDIESESLELKAEMIRRGSDAIGRLTGRIETEEWLGAIFSRFCIGK